MKRIELQNVKRWIETSSKMPHPVSIHTCCPACHLNVVFSTRRRHYDGQRDTLAFSAECPSCSQATHFWMTDMTALKDDMDNDFTGLFMLPGAAPRLNLHEIGGLLPEDTRQYCASTLDVFQSGNYTATRVMVQSTLDAIFSGFLPQGNSRTTLFKSVQDSLPSMELDGPIRQLAASLRKGEALDVLLRNPDPATGETAEALMSLVEKLVYFLYVIPEDFRALETQLVELSRQLPATSRVFQDMQEAAETAETEDEPEDPLADAA